jgi:hypothetical protein
VAVVELIAVKQLEPFDFRWSENIGSFECGWSFDARSEAGNFLMARY